MVPKPMAERFWNRIALHPQALNPRARSTIRRSFITYAGLLLLIGWGYASWYVSRDYQRTVVLAGEQLRTVAASLGAQMEAMVGDGLGSAHSAFNDLRAIGPFAQVPAEEIVEQLRNEVTGNYIRALFVGSGERTVVAGPGFSEEIRGVPAWLSEPPGNMETTVSLPIPDPGNEQHNVIPVARGIEMENGEFGWVGMWFEVEPLIARYRSLDIERGYVSIVRADGHLLTGTAAPGRPAPRVTDLRGTDVLERILAVPSEGAHVLEGISELDRKRKLFAVAKAGDGLPLTLVVSREFRAVMAPWKRNTITVLWLALGSSVVLIVMTMLLYRFLDEINRREGQFLKLFENSLASILLLKGEEIVENNSQARHTFHIPEHETLHGRTLRDISADVQLDGTPTPEAIAKYQKQLSVEGGAVFEWLFKRVDSGELFEGEVNISSIHVADDVITLAMVRDISEQEAAKRELREVNQQLEARVAQRTMELQQANAQLAATNRALEEFTASASHDLRAPLSSISGQAGLLELALGDQLGIKGLERLARIQQAVKRASDVIDGLLSLSRITRQELSTQTVNLSELAQAVIDELCESAGGRDVEVYIRPEMLVHADRGLMTSLVANLIRNAWKYSGKRERVWIRFDQACRDGEVVYCVADRGAGFSMEHATRLFQAFRRLHAAEEFSGIGLGLATVQRIITRYGGRIWAEAAPDVGAKFFFTLPNAQLYSAEPDSHDDRRASEAANVM